jgi:predicted membrane protein
MRIKCILLLISLFVFAFRLNTNERSNNYHADTVVVADLGHHNCDLVKSTDIHNNYLDNVRSNNKMYCYDVNNVNISKEYIVESVNSTLEETESIIYRLKTIVLAGVRSKVKFNIYLYHSQNKLGFT